MWLIALLLGLVGCASPTSPTEEEHPKELLVRELVACYADPLEVKVSFFDKAYKVKVDWTCKKDCVKVPAAGRAMIPGHQVTFWRPWVHDASLWALKEVSAHEVCHVLHMSTHEGVASMCMARLVYQEKKC
jgi:hypothetical protein